MNGFRFEIPNQWLEASELSLSVLSETGIHLTNSPLRLDRGLIFSRPAKRYLDQRECLFFMHIQKTGGTAFREAIAPNYPGSARLYIYPTPPGIWRDHIQRIPPRQKKHLRYITGHFVFGLHRDIDIPSTYATVVRNPIARLASNYQHLLREQPRQISIESRILTLEQVLERQTVAELDNLIVRCFSGNGARQCPAGMIGLEAYELAVENLKYFQFIGHQERSSEAWRRLQKIFGWRSGALGRVNVAETGHFQVTERARTVIQHYCKFDLMLYNEILSRWPIE
jgi:hypothetical protein